MKYYFLIKLFTIVVIVSFATDSITAQVTIGSIHPPKAGAILDLKENDSEENNATKGLLLPRVQLSSRSNLFPMFANDADYHNASTGKKAEQDLLHNGMLVYNVNECLTSAGLSQGVYMWIESKWIRLGEQQNNHPTNTINTNYDQENNQFYSQKFGVAGEWMLQNLRVSSYADASTSPLGDPSISTGTDRTKRWAYPTVSGGDATKSTYFEDNVDLGYLYNWHAALNTEYTTGVDEGQGTANELSTGHQGICPSGWYVPSDIEWNTLEDHISSHSADYSNLASATPIDPLAVGARGTHSKAFRTMCLPIAEKSDGLSYSSYEGGLAVLLTGAVSQGSLLGFAEKTAYWTASSRDNDQAWQRVFSINQDAVDRSTRITTDMLSIRCKKTDNFRKCGDPLIDMEGNQYSTAQFGNAGCWMTQNIMSTANENVQLIEVNNDSNEENLIFKKTNGTVVNPDLGYLYTWEAAMGGVDAKETLIGFHQYHAVTKSNIQGICPEGWVLPSDYDWSLLLEEVNANSSSKELLYNNRNMSSQSESLDLERQNDPRETITHLWTSNDTFTPIASGNNAHLRGLRFESDDSYKHFASTSSFLSVRCKLKE